MAHKSLNSTKILKSDNLAQVATGHNLPQNGKSANLPPVIQLVFVEGFFGCCGNLVLDSEFNSSLLLQDHIHGNPLFLASCYEELLSKKYTRQSLWGVVFS